MQARIAAVIFLGAVVCSAAEPQVALEERMWQFVLELEARLEAEEWDAATATLRQMAALDPDHPKIYISAVELQRRRGRIEEAPALMDGLGPPRGPGRALGQGVLLHSTGRPEESPQFFSSAMELYRGMNHLAGEAASHTALGIVAKSEKKYDDAVTHFEAALELLEALADRHGQLDVLDNLADVERRRRNPEAALERYRQNLSIREQIGDRAGQARSWVSIGRSLSKLGDRPGAIAAFEKSLAIRREINNRPGQISSLNLLANVHAKSGNWDQALDYLEQACRVADETASEDARARALRKLGENQARAGRTRDAVQSLSGAVAIYAALDDPADEVKALAPLGIALNRLGEFRRAREVLERALEIARDAGDSKREAQVSTNLSRACIALGELTRALLYEERALALYRDKGDQAGELRSLTNLGVTYFSLGDRERARRYIDETLRAAELPGDEPTVALARNNLGVLLAESGEPEAALEQFLASVAVALGSDDRRGSALARTNAAAALHGVGRSREAFEFLDRALTEQREVEDRAGEAFSLNMLGELQLAAGKPEDALKNHHAALVISDDAGLTDEKWRAHAGKASALEQLDKTRTALEEVLLAIDGVESVRSRIESPSLKMRFLAGKIDLYEHALSLSFRRGDSLKKSEAIAQSFQIAERARARSLLDLLAESRSELRSGLDVDLRRREEQILESMSAAAAQLAESSDPDVRVAARQRLLATEEQIERLRIEIRRSAPRYAEIAYPAPASLKEVQQRALLEGETLIEFFVGDEQSWVWLVNRTGATLHALSAPDEIAARVEVFLDRVSAGAGSSGQAELRAAAELAAAVIPSGALPETGRLLIVPDGPLHHVPLEALRVDDRFLIETHEIAVVPSATALMLMRTQPSPMAATGFLGIGDPLLPTSQSRFPRLPFSLAEVNRIAELFPEEQRQVLTGEQATMSGLRSLDLETFRFIHFATHGWLDADNPRLSGLKLSEDGANEGASLLSLNEILTLRLSSEVVVISSCQSGLGELLEGEGLVGLTRSFLFAGSRAVIVSLWNVGDRSTADLMSGFYRELHGGKPPTTALREAKLRFLKGERPLRRQIRRWAPFILVGEPGRMNGM